MAPNAGGATSPLNIDPMLQPAVPSASAPTPLPPWGESGTRGPAKVPFDMGAMGTEASADMGPMAGVGGAGQSGLSPTVVMQLLRRIGRI